jgi:UDP-N-acetylmuramoylalanine--D-glutamate ligase
MSAAEAYFKGKKITLMGLGLLGRGVGDAEFLAAVGAVLIVTDLKDAAALAPSLSRLEKFPNITYHLGGHRMEDFENRDLIIRAANVPLGSPFIAHARELHIPVEMDASLFMKLSPAMTVGITGTRGKSTTTHLIYEILKAAGKDVHLGGNERGTATLPLLQKTTEKSIVVLELDSWQLQGLEDGTIGPHVSVWTNFFPDHMNYYKNDMDRYFADKAAIARFQKSGDYFITTKDIKEQIESWFGALQGTCLTDATLPSSWNLALRGEHNRQNAAYACAAARCLGIPDDVIKGVLALFAALPGRLEPLGEKSGIAYYNDSNSTTPEATIAALATLSKEGRPIILIAGGSDKALDYTTLIPIMETRVKKLILFKGTATDQMERLLPKTLPATVVLSMDEAMKAATTAATPGDIILLSPAAASFGIFRNEYDRGDQFRAAVQKLK